MTQRTHLDDFLRGRIIGRLECGRTQLEVSDELGIAQSVISRLWQRFQDDSNVSRRYSTGCPRVTTPNGDRYLAGTAKRNRRSTASDLSRQLSSATGTTISRQTVYRRLGQTGLYARRPVSCVPLTETHCRLRLAWSREHVLWTPQQWACVMFSDKSRFSLQSDSCRTALWTATVGLCDVFRRVQAARDLHNELFVRAALYSEVCIKLAKTASENHDMIKTAYETDTMGRSSVFEGHKYFRERREQAENETDIDHHFCLERNSSQSLCHLINL
ncbi:Transposable element Tc1 transposase, partial [Stegodyphus mimosarum]